MLHGEAVAVGMVAEAKLAERLSIANPGLANMLAEALSGLGLPVEIPKDLRCSEIVSAMKMDKKKSNGAVRFSLPVKIGEVQAGIEINDLRSVLEEK
jgi:3-dehydroquinate synthetase